MVNLLESMCRERSPTDCQSQHALRTEGRVRERVERRRREKTEREWRNHRIRGRGGGEQTDKVKVKEKKMQQNRTD